MSLEESSEEELLEEYWAVTDRYKNHKVLGIETSDFLFHLPVMEEDIEDSDVDLIKFHRKEVWKKYPFEILMFRNVFPLRENEKRTIETAFKKGKQVHLKFPHTAPVTVPIQESPGLTTLDTFYNPEPFNPYIVIG